MATTVLPDRESAMGLRPGPVTRRLLSDGRLLAGAGYGLLLQVAHPVVAAGVAQHSDYAGDPWGRLLRTLDYLNVMVFGGPQAAVDMARRTRARHHTVNGVRPDGERYHALDPEPFAWVHATLVHAAMKAHDRFRGHLAAWEREVLYADWRRLGRLVGVREADLPAGHPAFCEYFRAVERDVLVDNETLQGVLRTFAAPPPPHRRIPRSAWTVGRMPAAHGLRLATAGLLGPELRSRFKVSWSRADALEFAALGRASRTAGPLVPRPVRSFGPAYLHWRGLEA